MEPSFVNKITDKREAYENFIEQFALMVDGETEEVSVLANASAAIRQAFGFFWIGFYIVKNDILILGPFQGDVACNRIRKGKGVCGTAWEKAGTIVVEDVDKFPGHIACSSASRSEIVVPLLCGKEVRAVLDIDSDELATFDETDRYYLEKVAEIISRNIYR
jgi:L-methionine (R)-S-oxide reductase